MQRIAKGILIAAAGIGLSASVALALHNEPGIAKTIKVSVVTAYEPCTTPTLTTSFGDPACPAVRSDPVCGFAGGHGLMYMRTKSATGWAVKIVLLGLDQGCVGETLHFFATLRATTDDCGGAACTADFPNVDLGQCIVKSTGFCGLSTPVFSNPLIITKPGGVEIIDLKGMRGSLTSIRSGIVTGF